MTTNRNSSNNNMTSSRNQDNNNNISHSAGRVSQEAYNLILDAYIANVAEAMTGAVAHMIDDFLSHGMDVDTVIMAIEETGLAPKPSPLYLRAVLRNWAESGVVFSRYRDQVTKTNVRPWWSRR